MVELSSAWPRSCRIIIVLKLLLVALLLPILTAFKCCFLHLECCFKILFHSLVSTCARILLPESFPTRLSRQRSCCFCMRLVPFRSVLFWDKDCSSHTWFLQISPLRTFASPIVFDNEAVTAVNINPMTHTSGNQAAHVGGHLVIMIGQW